jgi:hypothetical protein
MGVVVVGEYDVVDVTAFWVVVTMVWMVVWVGPAVVWVVPPMSSLSQIPLLFLSRQHPSPTLI